VKKSKLKEIVFLFFKLGCIAYGGPAAHIAMMEEEVVKKRKWMSRQHFLDLIGITNLIPGPNSTEMTMHCGHEQAGWPGLVLAGICFIFPAAVITLIFAWLYVDYGQLPEVEPFIYGIKPVVLAIIASAIYLLGKKALKSVELGVLGGLVLIIALLGMNEIYALLSAGIFGAIYFYIRHGISENKVNSFLPIFFLPAATSSFVSVSTLKVFWTFLKVGAILYGSGYVLFAYLDAELVDLGLMTQQQLLDAIAVGQFTPGPVLSTATFIGYQLNGLTGAIAATVGIFLPSFLFVLFLNPLVPKMRKSRFLGYFLDSVNVAAVAVMIGVLLEMGYETLTEWQAIMIAILSFMVTFGLKKVSAVWIVLGGSVLGFLLKLI
jgi:chromate transporter